MKILQHQRGFGVLGVLQVMVVIIALAVLLYYAIPYFVSDDDKERTHATKDTIVLVNKKLELFRRDYGRYPTNQEGLRVLLNHPTVQHTELRWFDTGYFDGIPFDAWGRPLHYINPNDGSGEVYVFSFGRSGQPNNEEIIGNWQLADHKIPEDQGAKRFKQLRAGLLKYYRDPANVQPGPVSQDQVRAP